MFNSKENIFIVDLIKNSSDSTLLFLQNHSLYLFELVQNYFLKTPLNSNLDNEKVNNFSQLFSKHEDDFLQFLIDNQEDKIESEIFNALYNSKYFKLLEIIENRKILKDAISKIERENFKNRFKELDDEETEFLSEFEINQGIKNVERNKLREKFKIIDQEEKANVNDIQHLDKKKNIISLSTFLKYAAILVILILPFYFINNWNSNQNKFGKKEPKKVKRKIDSLEINKNTIIEVNIDIEEVHLLSINLIQGEGFGYASIDKKIKAEIKVLDLKNAEKLLKKLNLNESAITEQNLKEKNKAEIEKLKKQNFNSFFKFLCF
jgi:hypothetical protein